MIRFKKLWLFLKDFFLHETLNALSETRDFHKQPIAKNVLTTKIFCYAVQTP